MSDYQISRSSGKCCVSGKAFEVGEEFYSVVLESKDGLERRDYSQEAWQGTPEGTLCHFKTRMPGHDEPKKTFIDDESLTTFFLRLADTTGEMQQRFRFVLSLILLRKRLLKYVGTVREADDEFWIMQLRRDKSEHRVFNPRLDDQQIMELSGELNAILHDHIEEVESPDGPGEPLGGEAESTAGPDADAGSDSPVVELPAGGDGGIVT